MTGAIQQAINGVSLVPLDKALEMGRRVVDYRAGITVAAIRRALAASR